MKFHYSSFLLILLFLTACSKKQEDQEAVYSAGYKTISVTGGGTIKGTVKTEPNQKYQSVIETQKDQDVCGTSHANQSLPNAEGKVPNCIIWLEKISEGKEFSKKDYALDQKGCEFLPYVQIVPVGMPIVIQNSDKALHNFHITRNGETILNEAQPDGAPPREADLKQKGLHIVKCDVHPWMKGFIWVADHPYYSLSDVNGSYTLTDVPPGKYKLILWRDNWNVEEVKNSKGGIESYKWAPDFSKEQEVTVEAGKDAVVDFTLTIKVRGT